MFTNKVLLHDIRGSNTALDLHHLADFFFKCHSLHEVFDSSTHWLFWVLVFYVFCFSEHC